MNLNLCAVLKCTEQPLIQIPLLLCREHALMVSLNVTDVLHANALAGPRAELDVERVSIASDNAWAQQSHPSVVYFMVNGDRVKIGVSTNISARTSALCLRRKNAALLLQGGHDLEDSLHQHFDSDRIGQTEWFVFSRRIQDYIARRKEADAALRQPRVLADDEVEPEQPTSGIVPFQRPPTADEKILEALEYISDSLHIDYAHKDQIGARAGLTGSTLDNSLSRLSKTRRVHRKPKEPASGNVRGYYGLGPGDAEE